MLIKVGYEIKTLFGGKGEIDVNYPLSDGEREFLSDYSIKALIKANVKESISEKENCKQSDVTIRYINLGDR